MPQVSSALLSYVLRSKEVMTSVLNQAMPTRVPELLKSESMSKYWIMSTTNFLLRSQSSSEILWRGGGGGGGEASAQSFVWPCLSKKRKAPVPASTRAAPDQPVGAVNEVDDVNVRLAGVGHDRHVDAGGRVVAHVVKAVGNGQLSQLEGRGKAAG